MGLQGVKWLVSRNAQSISNSEDCFLNTWKSTAFDWGCFKVLWVNCSWWSPSLFPITIHAFCLWWDFCKVQISTKPVINIWKFFLFDCGDWSTWNVKGGEKVISSKLLWKVNTVSEIGFLTYLKVCFFKRKLIKPSLFWRLLLLLLFPEVLDSTALSETCK